MHVKPVNKTYRLEILCEISHRFLKKLRAKISKWAMVTHKPGSQIFYMTIPDSNSKRSISLILRTWFTRKQYHFKAI